MQRTTTQPFAAGRCPPGACRHNAVSQRHSTEGCCMPLQAQVRQLAVAADLPNKARRDSQGICFLGKVKFAEFVQQHLGTWPGPLVEAETDKVIGYHEGYWFHTLGQRKGIHLSGGPW